MVAQATSVDERVTLCSGEGGVGRGGEGKEERGGERRGGGRWEEVVARRHSLNISLCV